jgi:hypothetical protein
MKAWMLTCRTLWHCEITNPRASALPAPGSRPRQCSGQAGRKPVGAQARHWTRRVLHQPLVRCRPQLPA